MGANPALHISVSQIKTYLRCPRQYQLKYVLGEEPAFRPLPIAFGSAIHEALADFYNCIKSSARPPPLEALLQAFLAAWSRQLSNPLPIQVQDDAPDPIDEGVDLLRAFYVIAARQAVEVEAVEQPFAVPIYHPLTGEVFEEQLVGTFDLLLRDGPSRLIVEHKTSSRRYNDDQLRFDIQPSAYIFAAEALGLGHVPLRYQILMKTKTKGVQIEDVERVQANAQDLLTIVAGVLKAVDGEVFYPLRGWACRSCPFAPACQPGISKGDCRLVVP